MELFFTFFKIGAFTFGGGYAMIPLIEEEVVENKGWMTNEEFIDVVAIAESTPGPLAVNTATYVGYRRNKMKGVISATLGVIMPSFLIILIIAKFLWHLRDNDYVARAFSGIRFAVVALVANAWWKLAKDTRNKLVPAMIMIVVALIVFFIDISPILLIAIGGIMGLFFSKVEE